MFLLSVLVVILYMNKRLSLFTSMQIVMARLLTRNVHLCVICLVQTSHHIYIRYVYLLKDNYCSVCIYYYVCCMLMYLYGIML